MLRHVTKMACTAAAVFALSVSDVSAQTLKIGRDQDSTTLDPIKTAQNVDIWIITNLHAGLVRSNREGTSIEPDLAESWTVSEDNLTFDFTLREASFSDGSPVTAEDVVFSLTRLRDDDTSTQGWLVSSMESVEATGDRSVRITLSEPSAAFIPTLALYAAAIVPQSAVGRDEEAFGGAPVGAGRFRLQSWDRGAVLTLEPNPHYYGGAAENVEAVEYYVVPDANTRILQVQAAELDVAMGVPFAALPGLEGDSSINIHLDASTREDHLLLNHEHPVLGNADVRAAIDMAINKDAIVQVVTFNNGVVANSPIPMGTPFYNADAPQNRSFDPDAAREMVANAGADGAKLRFLVGAGNKLREQTGVIIQQQLAAIGLEVEIVKVDAGQVWSTFQSGDYDIAPAYWTYDVLDPDHKLAFSLDGGSNLSYYTRYSNPAVTDLLNAARQELDVDVRQGMYDELLTIAKSDTHWIDLYYVPFSNISRAGVNGFFQNPMGVVPLHEITIEQ